MLSNAGETGTAERCVKAQTSLSSDERRTNAADLRQSHMGRIALLRRVPAVSVGNIPVGCRIFPL